MLWKIRTELADRPGALAELAARCGAAEINILSLEVFTAEDGAVDELVVSTGVAWTAEDLIALVQAAGCGRTTVKPCQAEAMSDAPTRYLRAVLRILDDPCSVDEELERLQGLDQYTPAEWARADVLVEIAGRLAERPDAERYDAVADPEPYDVPDVLRPGSAVPEVRTATVADAAAVVAMHERCSYDSRTRRYHVPMPRLTSRTARHLSAPAGGVCVVACVGATVIGMATAAPWDELSPAGIKVMEIGVLVEDGWQRRGIGAALLARVVREARSLGADRAVCMVQPDNAAMLRTVEGLRMRTRVEHDGSQLMVMVALSAHSLSHAADRPAVAYRQMRAIDTHRGPTAPRVAGTSARQYPLAGAGAVPAVPDRARAAGAHGADRGGRP
jgi:L-amino acid N-acyltransferase YncA